MFDRVKAGYNAVMDKIFAVLDPIAGQCPVCALLRGAVLGGMLTYLVVLMARMVATYA